MGAATLGGEVRDAPGGADGEIGEGASGSDGRRTRGARGWQGEGDRLWERVQRDGEFSLRGGDRFAVRIEARLTESRGEGVDLGG